MPVPTDYRNELLSHLNIVYDLIEDHEQIQGQELKRLFRRIRDHGGINVRIRKAIRTLLCTILVIHETHADRAYCIIKLKVIRDYLKRMIATLKLNSHMELCILDREIDRNTCHWENIQYSFSTMFSEIGQLLHNDDLRGENEKDKYRLSDNELQQRSETNETLPTDLDD